MARTTRSKTATAVLPPPPDHARYCPATYWGGLDPIVATIKGEPRRRRVLDLLAADRSDAIDEVLLGSRLPDDVARFLRALDPALLAGENLPDFERGEVEIARIVFRVAQPMVVSVRAHRYRGGIMLRVANDVGIQLVIPLADSCFREPLSLEQLIKLIDNVCAMPVDKAKPGIVRELLEPLLAEGTPPDSVAACVEVDSVQYPGLREAQAARIKAWCASWAKQPPPVSRSGSSRASPRA